MKSVGIIAEYNPFHNGHLYHLNKVKEMFPNHNVVLVLSGNFLQRGEISIINKYDKTRIALEAGIDLIVELPFNFATQSADIFARGAIEILNTLKVNTLVFGSESDDITSMVELANIQLNNKEYQNIIKNLLDKGFNYPTALSQALKKLTGTEINTPNDILGLSYVREIIKNNYNIKPISIKRTNDYHDLDNDEDIISASNIRNKLKDNIEIEKYIPKITYKYLNKKSLFISDYYNYLKYNIISNINNLDEYLTVDEGIDKRIKKFIYKSNSYEELIMNLKTKRYTYNKLSRMLCHILTNYKKMDTDNNIEYIRILGMNNKGKQHLNKLKSKINIPIITKFSDFNEKYRNLELKLAHVYSINNDKYTESEISSKVIIKKE
ncbi:MAG: nucleotidyltransferase [Bacilli bacterium]|nr:nucleotidyltransferase [Bacilli bacterium]